MSPAAATSEQMPLLHRIAHLWRCWRQRRTAVAELNCCGHAEQEHIARDLAVGAPDLRILAGKWPDSADLLNRRMEQLKLDAAEIKQAEPQVIRDLQRVCTLCQNTRRCARDLAADPSDPVWQEYCPNTGTLAALTAERAAKATKQQQSKSVPTERGRDFP